VQYEHERLVRQQRFEARHSLGNGRRPNEMRQSRVKPNKYNWRATPTGVRPPVQTTEGRAPCHNELSSRSDQLNPFRVLLNWPCACATLEQGNRIARRQSFRVAENQDRGVGGLWGYGCSLRPLLEGERKIFTPNAPGLTNPRVQGIKGRQAGRSIHSRSDFAARTH
jgi:hypothetical protein